MKSRVGNTTEFSFSDVKLVPFIFGIILIVVGLVDMLVLYFVPYSIIKNNKKKYPNQSFEKPNTTLIAIHFILHSLIIFLGIILILIAFEIKLCNEIVWIIVLSSLIFIVWAVGLGLGFYFTKLPKSEMTVEDLISLLNKDPPSNLMFIYTSDTVRNTVCTGTGRKRKCRKTTTNCYSKSGISMPIQTKIIQNSYKFDDAPKLFYIDVQQNANMSRNLASHYRNILSWTNVCDAHKKAADFYPLVKGEYIISNKKVPVGLSKGTRYASIILGVGVYYEMYSKSVPHMKYVQYFDADVVDPFDYNGLWKSDSCAKYGTCSTNNKKPSP